MTIDEALKRMFDRGHQPPTKYIRDERRYGAWVAGIGALYREYGLSLHIMDKAIASYGACQQLMNAGCDPDRIVALYVLCFEA